jgi:endonuclease V-like protein UPF0215 family
MKPGSRALGVAESYRAERSTLAGAVVRANRILDGVVFGQCTVGGSDATVAVTALCERLDREDWQYLLVAGIAPAWFNVLDLQQIHEAVDRPVVSVSYEASKGLAAAIREHTDDPTGRLATYRAQPERHPVDVGDEQVWVRAVGLGENAAADVVRAFTPEGGRPEPLRVARLAARGADEFVHRQADERDGRAADADGSADSGSEE